MQVLLSQLQRVQNGARYGWNVTLAAAQPWLDGWYGACFFF